MKLMTEVPISNKPDPKGKIFMSNKVYDILKWIAQILLPALGTFYFTMSGLWDLPNVEQVVGSITAVDVLLGLLLGVSTKAYNASDAKYDGSLDVSSDGIDTTTFKINLTTHPVEIESSKKEVTFRVNPVSE